MQHDADARVSRRLATRFGPECWIALCVRVVAAASHETADAVSRTPDHYLAAAWPPPASGPAHWPDAVVIGSPTSTRALEELLRHLPAEASLYLAGLDDVDAALAASILLEADRNLEPYQREAIEAFVKSERERVRISIAFRYTDCDQAFEQFRAVVLGDRGV
jgi:hypothetical protein